MILSYFNRRVRTVDIDYFQAYIYRGNPIEERLSTDLLYFLFKN